MWQIETATASGNIFTYDITRGDGGRWRGPLSNCPTVAAQPLRYFKGRGESPGHGPDPNSAQAVLGQDLDTHMGLPG